MFHIKKIAHCVFDIVGLLGNVQQINSLQILELPTLRTLNTKATHKFRILQ